MTDGPWLVTGASGFLGRHLLDTIARTSSRPVIALVRDPAAWERMDWTGALPNVRTLTGSVTEPGEWTGDPALDGLAGICHLAAVVGHGAHTAPEVERTGVAGTVAMTRLAGDRRCRLLFVSTSGTVGCFRAPGQSADEDAPYCEAEVARWPYYRSKVRAEREARALAGALGVDVVIARPPVLLGPGDHRFRSTNHILRLMLGSLPFVIEGGMHFADVRDVAAALARIMALPNPRPVYHLPGTICSIGEFYDMVAAAAKCRPPRWVLPLGVARTLARLGEALGRIRGNPIRWLPEATLVDMASHHWAIHSPVAAAEIGYRSRPGPETLADAVAWLRSYHPDLQGR